MLTFITVTAVGLLLCVIGAVNMTGNISSLHSYHRHRVREEDKKPFGRLVGIGMLLIGASIILFGVLFFIYEKTGKAALIAVGVAELLAGIATGLGISFYATIKYNKGIF